MIRVRAARTDDVSRIQEIARHSVTAAHWKQDEYNKFFAPDASPGLLALVITENDQVMGFLAARQIALEEWEIENVAVSGGARRRGLGSHLLGEFLKTARDLGGQGVFLEVRESNHAARALYEKWAFVEAGRRKNYYHEPCEDALVLRFAFADEDEWITQW